MTGPARLSARPEQIFFADKGLPGKVLFSTFLGDFIEYEVAVDGLGALIVNDYTKDTSTRHADGEAVFLSFDPAWVSIFLADEEVGEE